MEYLILLASVGYCIYQAWQAKQVNEYSAAIVFWLGLAIVLVSAFGGVLIGLKICT
jgi:predicted negative regulator of RcsB-dependent stress response